MAIETISETLSAMGFECHNLMFDERIDNRIEHAPVSNLYARHGSKDAAMNVLFLGHSDVVPPGSSWKYDPFAATIADGMIHGRGAVDMKGAICSFISAIPSIQKTLHDQIQNNNIAISMLITGDEEGLAVNGAQKVLQWMRDQGEKIDFCLIGEPVSKIKLADTIKIGARGSATFTLSAHGVQGHVAYENCYINAATELNALLNTLITHNWNKNHDASSPLPHTNLEITKLQSDSGAENVVPKIASAQFNIRYNSSYTAQSLNDYIHALLKNQHPNINFHLKYHSSGDAFQSMRSDKLTTAAKSSIEKIMRINPQIDGTGGTSDARFLKAICPFVEIGLLRTTAHQVNEKASLQDIEDLAKIYLELIINMVAN